MKRHALSLLMIALLASTIMATAISQACAADAAPKAAETDDKKKSGADTTGGRFAGDPIYIHMAPMVLPVINENGVEQLVTIILDVQVKNFDAADQMHSNMPRVQDALMRALYGGLGQGALRNGKLVDIAKVKNKAVSAVGEVIGLENVQDVLVQGVAQRML